MKPTLYNFNYSQDIVHLQTKYSLFQRVSNIIFSITFEEGFEDNIMYQAIQLLIERNDCLRLKTIKEGKEIKQYFEKGQSNSAKGKLQNLSLQQILLARRCLLSKSATLWQTHTVSVSW